MSRPLTFILGVVPRGNAIHREYSCPDLGLAVDMSQVRFDRIIVDRASRQEGRCTRNKAVHEDQAAVALGG